MNYTTHQQRSVDLFRRALLVGLGAQLLVPAAVAQDAAPEQLATQEITGTRLSGAELESALSVSTYNLDKPTLQGYSSPAEMLRLKLPQFGGGTGTANDAFANGGDGSASISLRGLPLSRTLLLLNGRRITSGDLNLIPQGAIAKIDVLNDGASPIYGSDAIAGVINIITKKGFDGFEVGIRYGDTTDKNIGERRFWATWGESTEKGSISLTAEYNRGNGQFSPDRVVSTPSGGSVSGTSNPGTFAARGLPSYFQPLQWSLVPGNTRGLTNASQIPAGFNPVAYIDARIPDGSGGYLTNASGAFQTISAQARLAAQRAEQDRLNALLPANTPVRYGPSPSLLPGVNPGFPFDYYTIAVRPFERYGAMGSADRKLFGENLEVYSDFSYMQNNSVNQLAPSPLSGRTVTTGNYWYNTVFPGANSDPLNFTYRPVELGPRITYQDWQEVRLVAGLRGRIGESTWKWDGSFMYDRARLDETQTGGVLRSLYDAALADPTAAGAFNPFGYTPLFGTSVVNSQAMINGFAGSATQQDTYTTQQFLANVGGEVFDLPGGTVAVSGGYEMRRESTDNVPDGALLAGSVFPFNADSVFRSSRDINSVYGEVNIPILGEDVKLPGMHSFSVQLAGRYEDFSDVGDTGVKPRVAFRWEVLEKELTLRGSWAQGFVAPGLRDLNVGSPQQSFTEGGNPLTDIRKQPTDGVIEIGNPGLKPAESDSYLIGAVYSPEFVKGLTVGANYYRIEENGIPFSSAQYAVNQWWANEQNPATAGANNPFGPNATPSAGNPLGSQVTLESNGDLKEITNIGPINTGQRVTDGVDLFASYEFNTDIGKFTLAGSATRVLSFQQENFPGAGKVDYLGIYWGDGNVLGNYGFPEWKSTTSITWEQDRYSASLAWNFTDGYEEIDNNNRPVSSYNTFDARVGYRIHKLEADLSLGVNNLFDEQPELVTTGFVQWDRAVTDIRGRQYYVQLTKKF
jgi:outer membrane receptor protein involved in Fe transport